MGSPVCCGAVIPLGLCLSPLGQVMPTVQYSATTLQVAPHQFIFHTATAISADLCKSRVTPLKLVDLLWDKTGTAKGQLLPMDDEMLPTY